MGAEHLDDATWEKLAMRELDDDARASALEHVMRCKSCAKIHKALLGLEADARKIDPAGVPSQRRRVSGVVVPLWRRYALPAAAILAAAAAVLLWVRAREPGIDPGGTVRGATSALVEGAPSPGAPREIAWAPVPGADAYRVRVMSTGGRLVWTSTDRSAPPAQIPPVVAAGSYFVKVEAISMGAVIGESRLMPVTLP